MPLLILKGGPDLGPPSNVLQSGLIVIIDMLQNCITSFLITQFFCNVLTPKSYIVSTFNDRNFIFFIMEHFLYDAHTIPNVYTHFFKPLYDSLRGSLKSNEVQDKGDPFSKLLE